MKIIYTTTRNEKEAKKIAMTLIDERLAACANIFNISSIYRWDKKINESYEVAMFIKTKSSAVNNAIKRIKELHSYDIPAILVLNVEKGYEKFLSWVNGEVK
ncbi:MAG: divalent-cation tolerance protein CutA [Candidatus Aenigmatarchaeota archaeon]